jgi:protein TonB
VTAQRIEVQITPQRAASPQLTGAASEHSAETAPELAQPPPPQDAPPPPPDAPTLTAVATPNPSIAFAVPVDRPAQVVDPKHAIAAGPTEVAATASPSVQRLTYGRGEGRQPAPIYPYEAALAHQQGTVVVRFTVDANGNVTGADALAPSPWPLLNQAAVRAVRDTWHFTSAAAPRVYEVSITFKLKEQ